MSSNELSCRACGQEAGEGAQYACSHCFGPLKVQTLTPQGSVLELKERILAGPHNLRRYRDWLPLTAGAPDPLPAGATPLIRARRLEELWNIREVWIKNETANPTHSFKDRVVSVATAKAYELGYNVLACASTGNLAQSVAAYAAAYGFAAHILVPEDTEVQKIQATNVYAPNLVRIKGSYDDANRLCTELLDEYNWACVNINLRPYYAEGSKSLGFEIMEGLDWQLPDRCIVPVASGSLFSKIGEAFSEWQKAGLVCGPLPKMHGAQAQGCAPVASAYQTGESIHFPVKPATRAKSLAIGNPADSVYALELARQSQGSIEAVAEEDISAGISLLAQTTGIFTESAGGVTMAAAINLVRSGQIERDERIVITITGEGLKTLEAVDYQPEPSISPTLAAFESCQEQLLVPA